MRQEGRLHDRAEVKIFEFFFPSFFPPLPFSLLSLLGNRERERGSGEFFFRCRFLRRKRNGLTLFFCFLSSSFFNLRRRPRPRHLSLSLKKKKKNYLRGSSSHVLDEAERSLHDALCVLAAAVADPRVVYGGGWPELRMARAVAEAAVATPGKKALAMEGFATALRGIPSTICDNAGLDAAEVVTRLRAAHAADPEGCTAGVDVRGSASGGRGGEGGRTGSASSAPIASDGGALNLADAAAVGVGCMKTAGVTEAFRVKRQVLLSATEAAEMILRVDDIVKAAPRPRERE